MKSRQIYVLSALALAAGLTACGGGGGGASTTTTVTPPVAPITADVSTIVTTATAANYAAGSEEAAAFNRINAERSQCGFGFIAQNLPLDAAARAHGDYQNINNLYTHTEDQVNYPRGFTGVNPVDRANAQRYSDPVNNFVNEGLAKSLASEKTGFGENGVRLLLNAPYHLRGLVSGYRDLGVSVRNGQDNAISQPGVYLTINMASTKLMGHQMVGSSDVVTYPCEGTSGVRRLMSGESPNPVPGRDLAANPLGSTVYIAVRPGNTLVVTTSSMTKVSNGQVVTLRPTITAANDPNKYFALNEAYIAADTPLEKLTSYRVMLTGTNNGVAFDKSFVFTTSVDL